VAAAEAALTALELRVEPRMKMMLQMRRQIQTERHWRLLPHRKKKGQYPETAMTARCANSASQLRARLGPVSSQALEQTLVQPQGLGVETEPGDPIAVLLMSARREALEPR